MDNAFVKSPNEFCRTCLTKMYSIEEVSSLSNIVNVSAKPETLSCILYQCTSVEVFEQDPYSHYICSSCLEKLMKAYIFRKLCNYSEQKLKNLDKVNVDTIEFSISELKSNDIDIVKNEIKLETLRDTLACEDTNFNNEILFDDFDQTYTEMKKEMPLSPLKHNCLQCDQKFLSEYALNEHKVKHRNNELRCYICDKQFSRKSDVKRHMYTHTGEKPYPCSMCGKAFNQSGSLVLHLRKGHDLIQPKKDIKEKRIYLCSICGKSFKDSGSLTVHIRRHKGEKPYECSVCKRRFVSRARVTTHMRVHTGEKPFTCNICGKRFGHSSVIYKHMKSHEKVLGSKSYYCQICPKSFTTLYYLKIHKRLHTGEKPHECQICHKTFSDPKGLKSHNVVHTNIRSHLCGNCGKSFKRSQHLNAHMKTHIGY